MPQTDPDAHDRSHTHWSLGCEARPRTHPCVMRSVCIHSKWVPIQPCLFCANTQVKSPTRNLLNRRNPRVINTVNISNVQGPSRVWECRHIRCINPRQEIHSLFQQCLAPYYIHCLQHFINESFVCSKSTLTDVPRAPPRVLLSYNFSYFAQEIGSWTAIWYRSMHVHLGIQYCRAHTYVPRATRVSTS